MFVYNTTFYYVIYTLFRHSVSDTSLFSKKNTKQTFRTPHNYETHSAHIPPHTLCTRISLACPHNDYVAFYNNCNCRVSFILRFISTGITQQRDKATGCKTQTFDFQPVKDTFLSSTALDSPRLSNASMKCEAKHPVTPTATSSAEVKNPWRNTSTWTYVFSSIHLLQWSIVKTPPLSEGEVHAGLTRKVFTTKITRQKQTFSKPTCKQRAESSGSNDCNRDLV